VMNVAKPGWGTADQVPAVEELLTGYGVDEIVLCYVLNDIEKTLVRSDAFDPTKPPEAWFFNPESSCLIDYLYWTLYVPRLPSVRGYHDWLMKGYSDEAAWRRQQEHLGAIIEHCKSKGVPLRVVLLPFLRTGSTAFDASGIHAKMRDFFAANGVETLDLLPAISDIPPDQLVVNRKDAHPNAAAHERFAEAIWQSLFKNAQ